MRDGEDTDCKYDETSDREPAPINATTLFSFSFFLHLWVFGVGSTTVSGK
jgi:hypothetical protein